MLPFRVSSPFVYVRVNLFIDLPRKCATVASAFLSLFAPTEIPTGECIQHDNPVRNKSHTGCLLLPGYPY